ASTILWYGTPYNFYERRDVSYHRLPDYRNLPADQLVLSAEKSEDYLNKRSQRLKNIIDTSFAKFVKGIPANDDNWCKRMAEGKLDAEEQKKLEGWAFTNEEKTISAEVLEKGGDAVNHK
uniref:Sulfatase n=1 Tax=Meloidogyne hapla TaxID=6305 RepID=A0A1I8BJ28_MELHA